MRERSDYQDALPTGRVRGRGAGINPGNRFEDMKLHVLGEHLDEIVAEHPDGTRVTTKVYADRTKTIINPVDSPDLNFHWTINPYRGCEHGCIYCYARPGHEYLGLSCGLDFETKILAKFDAPSLLRKELLSPKWKGETIVMSGVTDPYQPIEAKLRITRRCLEICAEFAQPVSFITKNKLILRDLDVMKEMVKVRAVRAAISLTSLDSDIARKMEPRASSPADRLKAIEGLAAAGVPVTVMTAPIVPGLNDSEIASLLKAAKDAGATSAGYVILRLPFQIKALFLDWLSREFPLRASKIEDAIRDMRDGELYRAEFGKRMRGSGERAKSIQATSDLFVRKYSLNTDMQPVSTTAFWKRREELKEKGQMNLFL